MHFIDEGTPRSKVRPWLGGHSRHFSFLISHFPHWHFSLYSFPFSLQAYGGTPSFDIFKTPAFPWRPLGRGGVPKFGCSRVKFLRVLMGFLRPCVSLLLSVLFASLRGGPSVCVCSPPFWRGPFGGFAGLGGAPPPVGLPPFSPLGPWGLGSMVFHRSGMVRNHAGSSFYLSESFVVT